MMEEFGAALVFFGIAAIFLGIILMIVSSNKSKVEAGGAVFIGPFPVFLGGTSKNAVVAVVVFSLTMILLALIMGVIRW